MIRVKAPQYKLIRGSLYRRSFYTPWLRCVTSPQTDDIVKEIHKGSCGFNVEPRSMVVRITKQGYYWLSMHRDAAKVIQDCEKCKEQSAIRKIAKNSTITARSVWPFRIQDLFKWDQQVVSELVALRNFVKKKLLLHSRSVCYKEMDQDSTHMVDASKVPMLKPGEYELWRMRMEQYIQMIDYSLWEVIENGNAPWK
ncbi:reverse transcriptase domain-containing protein [Tanacetum coccineum]